MLIYEIVLLATMTVCSWNLHPLIPHPLFLSDFISHKTVLLRHQREVKEEKSSTKIPPCSTALQRLLPVPVFPRGLAHVHTCLKTWGTRTFKSLNSRERKDLENSSPLLPA